MLFSYTHVLSFSTWCLHQVYTIKRKSYTVDEVVDVIFAGDDSADEYMQSESSESESESYESEEPVATPELIRGMLFEEAQEQEVTGHKAYCHGHKLEKSK